MLKSTSLHRYGPVAAERIKLPIAGKIWGGIALLMLLGSTIPLLQAQTFSTMIPSSDYGYLDQYNLNAANYFVGNEACVPTSTTNALTLLQNLNPTVFGNGGLTGTTYANWISTDQTLITDMGTTPHVHGDPGSGGTQFSRLPYGVTTYLAGLPTNYNSEIVQAGQFNAVYWNSTYPQPGYITSTQPTPAFIYNALANNDAVLLSIDYSTSTGTYTDGGHELLANGITWNASSGTGTISFIDPLDPSQNYSNTAYPDNTYPATGPALETTGTITLLGPESGSPGTLLLEYNQYNGSDTAPISDGPFYEEYATIDNVLSLEVVPEPSQYGVLVFLASLGFIVRRRFSKSRS